MLELSAPDGRLSPGQIYPHICFIIAFCKHLLGCSPNYRALFYMGALGSVFIEYERARVVHVVAEGGDHEGQLLGGRHARAAARQPDESERRVRHIHAVEEVVVRHLPVLVADLRPPEPSISTCFWSMAGAFHCTIQYCRPCKRALLVVASIRVYLPRMCVSACMPCHLER